jgi:BMFP domain-containing protein YqiC
MQSRNTLFDDFVKVMNGAAGTIAGMTREAQAAMQERAREWIGGLDLVSREEFDAVKAMAAAARDEAEALKARVAALEAAVAGAGAVAGAEPAAAPKRRTRKAGGA